MVETGDDTAQAAAYGGLAREVTRRAAELICGRVQRGMGTAAMVAGSEPERMMRDLLCFLRQPAPDLAFEAAAGHVAQHPSAHRWG